MTYQRRSKAKETVCLCRLATSENNSNYIQDNKIIIASYHAILKQIYCKTSSRNKAKVRQNMKLYWQKGNITNTSGYATDLNILNYWLKIYLRVCNNQFLRQKRDKEGCKGLSETLVYTHKLHCDG